VNQQEKIGTPMSGALILPPDYRTVEGPLVFLGGPIQGAPDWQDLAIAALRGLAPSLHLANPRRVDLSDAFDFEAQVDWETHYLRRAAANGVLLFWLAREMEHFPNRAYGQTSRFELAEWKVRHERDGIRLVVGVEEGFSGGRYLRRRLAQDCPDVPVLPTLDEACRAVVERAYR
jgi:Nucleoside 2-deoxyribosyltransferase like